LQDVLRHFEIAHAQFANFSPKPGLDRNPHPDPNRKPNPTLYSDTSQNRAAHFASCADSQIARNNITINTTMLPDAVVTCEIILFYM